MKLINIILIIILGPIIIFAQDKNTSIEVQTVSHVDLSKYVGKWYEIAKIPNSFQKQCKSGTTAFYKLRDDGNIDVINSCYDEDGELDKSEGLAKVVDTVSNAKLEVSFVSILGIHLFWGDYWIIGLDKDYQYAVVGTPNRKYGWILSRTPKLSEDTLKEIFGILKDQGYNPKDFEFTNSIIISDIKILCDVKFILIIIDLFNLHLKNKREKMNTENSGKNSNHTNLETNERTFKRGVDKLRAIERVERLQVNKVIDLCLENLNAKSILDIGTGSGLFAEEFAKRGLNIIGIDLQSEMIENAKKYVPDGKFYLAPAEEIPIEDNSVDISFFGLVFHEVNDFAKSLKEAFRVSQKGTFILEWNYAVEDFGPPLEHRLKPEFINDLSVKTGYKSFEKNPMKYLVLYKLLK